MGWVPDELWIQCEPILGPHEPKKWKGGRFTERAGQRECLVGIVYLMATGCGWNNLPHRTIGSPSYATVWRRYRDWIDMGLWEQLRPIVTAHLASKGHQANEIEVSRPTRTSNEINRVECSVCKEVLTRRRSGVCWHCSGESREDRMIGRRCPDAEVSARIAYYQPLAAKEVPLFDVPFEIGRHGFVRVNDQRYAKEGCEVQVVSNRTWKVTVASRVIWIDSSLIDEADRNADLGRQLGAFLEALQ